MVLNSRHDAGDAGTRMRGEDHVAYNRANGTKNGGSRQLQLLR
jgi:hypothetical protein